MGGGVGKPASIGLNSVFSPGGCDIRGSPAALDSVNAVVRQRQLR